MLDEKDFELSENSTPNENEEEVEIKKDDFELVQVDASAHEQKFQTKPTTFLKDSLKRFRKNKSSVVATYILGILLLMSVLVPIFDTSDVSKPHPYETFLAPKLFDAGTGWWDGTKSYSQIAVDISGMPEANSEEEKQEYWWPSNESFPQHSAISKKKFTDEVYTNTVVRGENGDFGRHGYVNFGYYSTAEKDTPYNLTTNTFTKFDLDADLYLTAFDTYDVEKIREMEGDNTLEAPANYKIGESALFFTYVEKDLITGLDVLKDVQLTEFKTVHNIGSQLDSRKEEAIDIGEIIYTETSKTSFDKARFSVRMVADGSGDNKCTLIRTLVIKSDSLDDKVQDAFNKLSFTDATKSQSHVQDDGFSFWSGPQGTGVYLSKAFFCSFVYDTYEAAYGDRIITGFSIIDLLSYVDKGWLSFDDEFGFPTLAINNEGTGFIFDKDNFVCKILDEKHCPLATPLVADDFYNYNEETGNLNVDANITFYKYLGHTSMPRFLMGTDKSGRDMFKYVFEGLRTSLLLGIVTFIVCFTFGLIWGSISGYFGGTVDLVMERFTDILSGIPWIVVMTLIIIHLGSNFLTFALALCLTGWIGTAARTRTQFYRFRGREYVLASRTLGASDGRLIMKHILPNALGTIITGAVLMIPSVIFSEATISYLGLGLKGQSSLGVILSDNQSQIFTNSYLLLFPAVIIALVMISFNLFGNGLRDAINPSLKGEEE